MSSANSDLETQPLRGILSLLSPGSTCFISIHKKEISLQLLPFFLLELSGAWEPHLFSLYSPTHRPPFDFKGVTIPLSSVASTRQALELVRRELRKTRRNDVFIFDIAAGWKGGARSLDRLIGTTVPLLKKRKVRSLWLLDSETVTPLHRQRLVELGDLSIRMWKPGPGEEVFLHILSAKSVTNPNLFLPRPLFVNRKGLNVGPPIGLFASDRIHPTPVDSPSSTRTPLLIDPFEQLFARNTEAVTVFEVPGAYRRVNRRACEMLGREEKEFQGLRLTDIVSPRSRTAALRALCILQKKGKATAELFIRKKNGREIHVSISAFLLGNHLYASILRDTTNEKTEADRLMHSAHDLRGLFEKSPVAQALFVERRLLSGNNAFRSMFPGLPIGSARPALSTLLGKQNEAITRGLVALGSQTTDGPGMTRQLVAIASGDNQRHIEIFASPIQHQRKSTLHCLFVDRTETESVIRRINQSRDELHDHLRRAPGAIAAVADGRYVLVNASFAKMLGHGTPAELEGVDVASTLTGKDRKTVPGMLNVDAVAKTEPVRFDYMARKKDGSSTFVQAEGMNGSLGGRRVVWLHASDITAQRMEQERRRKEMSSLEQILALSRAIDPLADEREIYDAALVILMKDWRFELGAAFVLAEKEGIHGVVRPEGLPESVCATLSQQNLEEGLFGFLAKTHDPVLLNLSDYPPHLPFKSLFESEGIRLALCIPCAASQVPYGILFLCTKKEKAADLPDHDTLQTIARRLGTAVKNARGRTAAEAAEQRFRSMVENAPDVVYVCTREGHFSHVNSRVDQLLGHKPSDFYRSPDLWRTLVHPDERTLYSQRVTGQYSQASRVVLEYRMLPKGKAAYRWVRDSVHYTSDEQGTVMSFTGIVSDITDSREIEEALRKSGQLKLNILESVQEGVAAFDTELRCIDWNHAMESITGTSRSAMIGTSAAEGISGLSAAEFRLLLERALAGESVGAEDLALRGGHPSDEGFFWLRCAPLKEPSGDIRGVVAILSDVTSRRALERDIRESEETLRNVIDGMGDALMICDLQGRVWEVNKEFSRLTGFPRSEVLGMTFPYPWILDEEMSRFVMWIAELRERTYLRDFDMTWHAKDGRVVAISLNTSLLRNALGEPVAMLNIARDITERRHLTAELERKTTQLTMLNNIISEANATMDFSAIFDSVALEVRGLVPHDVISVDLLENVRKDFVTYASSGLPEWRKRPGTHFPVTSSVSQRAVAEGRAVVIGSLGDEIPPGRPETLVEEGLSSHICIPIWLNERMLGILHLGRSAQDAFSADAIEILQPVADQIGAVIDRVRLFRRVSDDREYIHNLLNSIQSVVYTVDAQYRVTAVNKAWREYAELNRLDHIMDETSLIGKPLKDIVPDVAVWTMCEQAMPKLFQGSLEAYSAEYSGGRQGLRKNFQLTINPMRVDGKVTGLVFTHSDITAIKETEEEIKRRNSELVALNTISTSINKSLHLDDVLRVASEQIKRILRASMVIIYMLDQRKQRLWLACSLGLPDKLAPRIRYLPASGSATGRVIAEGKPLLISKGLLTDARVTSEGRKVFEELKVSSLGIIPLSSKDAILGALDVAFTEEHEFGEKEQQFLMLIGSQLGSAIENAQLYSEVQHQVQRLTSLYEAGRGLAGALDVAMILTTVHGVVTGAIPFERFTYYSVSEDWSSMQPEVDIHHGVSSIRETTDRVPIEEQSAYAKVLKTGTSLFSDPQDQQGGSGSSIIVPVRSKNQTAGLLVVSHSSPEMYEEAHLRLFESIAILTGIALERASLYVDIVNKSKEIESRNRELDDFTYVVSHDLKEPLISIEAYSKILMSEYGERIEEEGKEYLNSVVQSSVRLKTLIDDLLTLSRVGRAGEVPQVVSMATIVRDVLKDLQYSLKERNVTVHVEGDLPDVRFDPTQLGIVFRNLISNAIKFNTRENPVIRILTRKEGTEHVLSVEDDGIGIDKKYFDKIFQIFQRLHRSEQYRGTGAGLTIVKKIVENHQGRVWVESVLGEGSSFFFTIPGDAGRPQQVPG